MKIACQSMLAGDFLLGLSVFEGKSGKPFAIDIYTSRTASCRSCAIPLTRGQRGSRTAQEWFWSRSIDLSGHDNRFPQKVTVTFA
jgi:hypothetical protein